jgi:phosphotransferase system  glucose/maltose/N-acetylglucosamine-specific IIC component
MGKFMQAIGWIVFAVASVIFGVNVVYYTYKGVEATKMPGIILPHVLWVQPKTNTAPAVPTNKRATCAALGGEMRVGDAGAYWCVKDGNRIRPDGSVVSRAQ